MHDFDIRLEGGKLFQQVLSTLFTTQNAEVTNARPLATLQERHQLTVLLLTLVQFTTADARLNVCGIVPMFYVQLYHT